MSGVMYRQEENFVEFQKFNPDRLVMNKEKIKNI